jgi:hypothetical protein
MKKKEKAKTNWPRSKKLLAAAGADDDLTRYLFKVEYIAGFGSGTLNIITRAINFGDAEKLAVESLEREGYKDFRIKAVRYDGVITE